jgi:tRNA modification GTPase
VLLSRQLGTFARKLASLKQYGLVRLALQAVPSRFSDSFYHCGEAIGGLFLGVYKVVCFTFSGIAAIYNFQCQPQTAGAGYVFCPCKSDVIFEDAALLYSNKQHKIPIFLISITPQAFLRYNKLLQMKEVNTVEQTGTVAAIATPNAAGGIGIVRISGGDAIAVADKVFSAVSGKPLSEAAGYTAHFGTVNLDGKPIDEAIALVFRAPKSYTGEDTVELSCHGGVYIVRRVLRAVLGAGAQPAGPGEFTKRAFLNGRIDLAKAESVMSLISAQGEQAASAAFNTLEGRLSGRIEEVAHNIINVCAHLSAWVDYPDEDIKELSTDELEKTFTSAKLELEALIRGFENGRAITQGVDTVIVGRPNVGKSTLMNLLSGCERSIVTDVPGTTRDVVEQTVRVGENLLRLADTAGIRDTDNEVESIGVELAKKRLSRAELVIAVFDGARELTDEDREIVDFCSGRRSLAVVNKSDLGFVCDTEYIKNRFGAYVEISAKTAEGGGELEKALSDLLGTSDFDPSAAALTSERQRSCCVRALDSIKDALSALESGVTLDAVNVCADCAVDALLELTGERASEAVVSEVFSQFCVGK